MRTCQPFPRPCVCSNSIFILWSLLYTFCYKVLAYMCILCIRWSQNAERNRHRDGVTKSGFRLLLGWPSITQFLSDDLDQTVKMFYCSLFSIFPENHATSSKRSKVCVCVCMFYSCMYVCVCCSVCWLIGVYFPVFPEFWKVLASSSGYVCVCVCVCVCVISYKYNWCYQLRAKKP